ncbi:MAG TPA: GAF domain-containing sensor histidine kinase [Chloroflexota bacterium]|jgi:two-component system NarL family sensor kinase
MAQRDSQAAATRAARRGGTGPGAQAPVGVVAAVAEALNSTADLRQALIRTLTLTAKALELRTGWVWLLDPDGGHYYSAATLNLPPYLQEPVRMTGRPCWCIETFQAGGLTPRNVDVMECSRLRPAVGKTGQTLGLRYHASLPLYFQAKPLGIMNVAGPAWRQLTPPELALLSAVAYQVGLAVERARLAEASARLARAEERTRLAREIHDTLAQGLTAITLHLESALRHVADDPERARERLERALATAHDSLEDARRSVLDLRTAPLAGQPLPEALAALARGFTADTGVRVDVSTPAPLPLPLRVEAELYRIAQQALANVRRHAHAHAVAIDLRTTERTVRLQVRDDGTGFDPAAGPAGRHGLLGMRERARLLGGRLRLDTQPGQGTTLRVTVPLPEVAP